MITYYVISGSSSSKIASTISSSLIRKRPVTDSGTGDAKKPHIEGASVAPNATTTENGSAKNGV